VPNLGDTWVEILEAAREAQRAASVCDQLMQDPSCLASERDQAMEDYRRAAKRAYDAIEEARVHEYEGLPADVLDALREVREAGHQYSVAMRRADSSEPERSAAKEAYGAARRRLLDLLSDETLAGSLPADMQPGQKPAAKEPRAVSAAESTAQEAEEYPESPQPWALTDTST
jgi:hypothetical protein